MYKLSCHLYDNRCTLFKYLKRLFLASHVYKLHKKKKKSFRCNLAFTLRWVILHAYRQKGATLPQELAIERTSPRRVTSGYCVRKAENASRASVVRPDTTAKNTSGSTYTSFPSSVLYPTFAVDRHSPGTFSRTIVTSARLVMQRIIKNTRAAPSSRVYNL